VANIEAVNNHIQRVKRLAGGTSGGLGSHRGRSSQPSRPGGPAQPSRPGGPRGSPKNRGRRAMGRRSGR
jgi:hypothetical protein